MTKVRPVLICAVLATALPLSAQGITGYAQADAAHGRSLVGGGLCFMDTVVPSPMPPSLEWSGGGAAIDRRRNSIWISNGTELQEWPLDGDSPLCTRTPSFYLRTMDTHVSGLAYDIARNQLIQLETKDGIAALTYYSIQTGSGCLTPDGGCKLVLSDSSLRATAIAIDSRRDLLWIAVRPFGSHVVTSLQVYRRGDCQRICTKAVGGGVDAMAYAESTDTLFAATRTQMNRYSVSWHDKCPYVETIGDCAYYHPGTQRLRGFDLRKAHGVPVSEGCSGPGCANCTPLLDPVGMPVVGNAAFAMQLTHAPSGGLATLWMKPAPAVPTAYECGWLFTPLDVSGAYAVNVPIIGALPCNGTATLSMPLPLEYRLIGQIYVQATILCPGGGISLANATLLFVDSE
jgi:hypothetical protein